MKFNNPDHEQDFKILYHSITNAIGFRLYLAEYNNDIYRDRIITELSKNLKKSDITLFSHHSKAPVDSLDDFLPPGFQYNEKEKIVLSITGIENNYPSLADSAQFWRRMNFSRDSFRGKSPFPLVFWLLEGTFNKIQGEAQDFWSWRSNTFYFLTPIEAPKDQPKEPSAFIESKKEKIIPEKSFKQQLSHLSRSLKELKREKETEMNLVRQADILRQISELHLLYVKSITDSSLRKKILETALKNQLQSVETIQPIYPEIHLETARAYTILASIYSEMWDIPKSIEYELKTQKIYETIFERGNALIGESYNRLAKLYYYTGRLDEAMTLLKKHETICKELGERAGLAKIYGNQALILKYWGKLDQAMELHKKEEVICKELGDRARLAKSYGNQALIFQDWGKLDQAMESHKKEEVIFEELGDRAGIAKSYGNQALILQDWGKLDQAMELHKKGEVIFEELGDRAGIARSYGNQAIILEMWGKLDQAMELHKKGEIIFKELSDRAGLARSYSNQALILQHWGKLDQAMELYKKGEIIFKELGDRAGLARNYGNRAIIFQDWGMLDQAMELHKKEEVIFEELSDRDGLSKSYGNQALILNAWGKLDQALEYQKKKELICEELGDRAGLSRTWWNQGLIYNKRSDYHTQIALWQKAIETFKSIGIPTEKLEKDLADLIKIHNQ